MTKAPLTTHHLQGTTYKAPLTRHHLQGTTYKAPLTRRHLQGTTYQNCCISAIVWLIFTKVLQNRWQCGRQHKCHISWSLKCMSGSPFTKIIKSRLSLLSLFIVIIRLNIVSVKGRVGERLRRWKAMSVKGRVGERSCRRNTVLVKRRVGEKAVGETPCRWNVKCLVAFWTHLDTTLTVKSYSVRRRSQRERSSVDRYNWIYTTAVACNEILQVSSFILFYVMMM